MGQIRSILSRVRSWVISHPKAMTFDPGLEAVERLQKGRREIVEVMTRLKLLRGVENTRIAWQKGGDYALMFVGIITLSFLILLFYMIHGALTDPIWQTDFTGMKIVMILAALVIGFLVWAFIVLVVVFTSHELGKLFAPILLFGLEVIVNLWVKIRELVVPLGHIEHDELEYFVTNHVWPTPQELREEQGKPPNIS